MHLFFLGKDVLTPNALLVYYLYNLIYIYYWLKILHYFFNNYCFIFFAKIKNWPWPTFTSLTIAHIVWQPHSFQFLKEITNTACENTFEQPTRQTIQENILVTHSPMVLYRPFKHGKKTARMIAETKYAAATESLMQDGFELWNSEFPVPEIPAKFLLKVKWTAILAFGL